MTQKLSEVTDRHTDLKNLLWSDELRISRKLQALAGNTLHGVVYTNCFEKRTYCLANVKDDSR